VFAKFLQRNGYYDVNAFSDPAKAADFAANPDKILLL
jgi:hypothetical protein